jgi:hypothetical protein
MAGDAYVAATLETVVSEPSTIVGHDVKVELFRVFTRIWNALLVNEQQGQARPEPPPAIRISQITPLPRQAFLLSCLEGFSEEDTAQILDLVDRW